MNVATAKEMTMTTEKEMAKEMTVMTMTLMMQDMWEDVKMRVPALAPSNLGGVCNIMQVHVSFKWLKIRLKPLHQYELEEIFDCW